MACLQVNVRAKAPSIGLHAMVGAARHRASEQEAAYQRRALHMQLLHGGLPAAAAGQAVPGGASTPIAGPADLICVYLHTAINLV